jgi:HSP20 family protein
MLPKMSQATKPSGRLWYPAADVYETPEGWLVKVELAGISLEDVEMDIEGDTLYIAGTRRDGYCGGKVSLRQLEITYSRFEKILRFPRTIDRAKLEHDYKDGLLIIRLRAAK